MTPEALIDARIGKYERDLARHLRDTRLQD